MISDAQVEKSLEWLNKQAPLIGKAKAQSYLWEESRKSIKAKLMQECNETAANAKEIYAYAHSDYKDHLVKTAKHIEQYETLRIQRDYHLSIIEAYRTMEASKRAMANFR